MRINNELKRVVTSVVAVIGLLSSLLTFFTTSFNNSNIYLGTGIVISTILAVLFIAKWVPKGSLPDGIDDVAEEMDSIVPNYRFKIIFPCDDKYFEAANKLARDKFGKKSVSNKTVRDWKNRNEFILTCLSDNNRMVGYFDILPLKSDFALRLIKGEVGERDIAAENILAFHEIGNVEYIYFAGIAVQHTQTGQGCIHGTYLLASAIQYVKLFYQNTQLKKIITIPTSECGLKLTTRLKFQLEREGNLRQDGCDLYSKEFSINEIESLITSKQRIYDRFDISAYELVALKKTIE